MDSTAARGTSTHFARADHVHPSDTSRVPITRTVSTATGLKGGGALSSDRTIDYDIPSLTEKPSPDPNSDYIAIYDASGTATKKSTVGAVSAAASSGVTSIGGQTGGLTLDGGAVGTTELPLPRYDVDQSLSSTEKAKAQNNIGVRERLSANRTYYVRADGSDSNDGLANTSGGAWSTLQHAYEWIAANIDCGGFTVTVQVGSGTYTSGLNIFNGVVGGVATASSGIRFVGDTTTPSNVVISTSGPCILCTGSNAIVIAEGFKFTSSAADCLYASAGGYISISDKVDFGAAAGYHIHANAGGVIVVPALSYLISGSAQAHYFADKMSIIELNSTSVTLTGTPAFTWFAVAKMGYLIHPGCTFTGSATGSRYVAYYNGVVDSGGGGSSYFPGNSAGSTSAGGQYI